MDIVDEIDIITEDHMIIIKPKSMTDRVRGIVKKSNLAVEELDELYHITNERLYKEDRIINKYGIKL